MAIDTYAKLQSEILDTLNRTDLVANVTEYTPGTIEGAVQRAISKAERRIVRRLKTREFETSTSFSTVGGVETISIPADHTMTKAIILTGSPQRVLAQKDLTTLVNDVPSTAGGIPASYTLFGTTARLRPVPDTARALDWFYYAAPTPLSDSNTTNTLLQKYPDLLLYGALIEVAAHIEDDGRISLWKAAFDEAVKDITDDNTLNRWSGAPVTARFEGITV